MLPHVHHPARSLASAHLGHLKHPWWVIRQADNQSYVTVPHFQKEKALDFGWSTLRFNNDFHNGINPGGTSSFLARFFFSTQQALLRRCRLTSRPAWWGGGVLWARWTYLNICETQKLKPELRGFGGSPLLNHHLGWARDEKYWNTMREHIIKWQWHATQWTASNDFKVKLWKHHHISRHLEKQKHPFLRVSKGLTFWIWNSSFLLEFRDFKNWLQHMLTAAPVCWSRPRRGLQGQGRWWKLPSQAAAMRSQSCQHVQFQGRSALQRKVQLLGLPDLSALSASHFEQLLERRQMPCWQDQKVPSTQPSPKAQRSDESWWMPNCKATNPSLKLLRLEPKLC